MSRQLTEQDNMLEFLNLIPLDEFNKEEKMSYIKRNHKLDRFTKSLCYNFK